MRAHFVIAFIAAAALMANPAHARSIAVAPPPGEILRAAGLATDPTSLLRYLEYGIPPDHIAPPPANEHEQPFLFRRFGLYGTIVSALEESNVTAAAPLLRRLQSAEFSDVMNADLAVYVATQQPLGRDNTWDDWDLATRYRTDGLRMGCALALAKLSGESPAPFLEQLQSTWTSPLMDTLTREYDDHHLTRFYISVCRALTLHGSKSGIEALIAILEDPRGERFPAVSLLQQWTKQNFGPHYDDSARTKAAETEKWIAWWAANRDTFRADVANIQQPVPSMTPYPAPTTLRDRVWHASEGGMNYDGLYSSHESLKWLEANGARETRALRKIMDDENERMSVRAEALKWYVKFDRDPSYEMLLNYAKLPSTSGYNALANDSIRLIEERFPERSFETHKALLEAKPGESSNSVHVLAQRPDGIAFLIEHFSSLRDDTRFQAIQLLARQENPPISVLNDALLGDDQAIASFATIGVEAAHVEERLSPEVRAALNRWRANPEFRMERFIGIAINAGVVGDLTVDDAENVFTAITTDNPQAAEVYVRMLQSVGSLKRYYAPYQSNPAGVSRVEAEAMRGVLRCVETYRADRGITGPLPNYALP